MLYTYITSSILGMMCQKNCASTVHRAITSVKHVEHAVVTFITSDALVWIHREEEEGGVGVVDPSLSIQQDIISEVEDVGYDIQLLSSSIELSLQHKQQQQLSGQQQQQLSGQQQKQQHDRLPSNSFKSALIYKHSHLHADVVSTSDTISSSKFNTISSSRTTSSTTSLSIAPAVITEYLFDITGTDRTHVCVCSTYNLSCSYHTVASSITS